MNHCGRILHLRTKFSANQTNRCGIIAENCTLQYGVRPPYWNLKMQGFDDDMFHYSCIMLCIQNFIKIELYFTEI